MLPLISGRSFANINRPPPKSKINRQTQYYRSRCGKILEERLRRPASKILQPTEDRQVGALPLVTPSFNSDVNPSTTPATDDFATHRAESLSTTESHSTYERSVELRFRRDLRYLYDVLAADSTSQIFFDFLIDTKISQLADFLIVHPRLPNQIALRLKLLESQGLTPEHPERIVETLKKLVALAGKHNGDQCAQHRCEPLLKMEAHCIVSMPCLPELSEELLFSVDGSIKKLVLFEYSVKLKLWHHEIVVREKRELEIDEGSKTIRAQNPAGKAFVESLIESAKSSTMNNPWLFLFIDLNNLGQINYFFEGAAAGDAYVEAFADSIRSNLTRSDHFFRVGGDEFVIISENRSPEELHHQIEQMIEHFYNDPAANRIFTKQWRQMTSAIKAIDQISNFEALRKSPSLSILKTPWVAEAERDFPLFQERFKSSYQKELQTQLKWQRFLMKPTFSVGTKIIGFGDTFESLKTHTCKQSGECKRIFKEMQGANATKVGGEEANPAKIQENIRLKREIRPLVLPTLRW